MVSGIFPVVKIFEHIRADQKVQLRVGKFVFVVFEGQIGETGAFGVDLVGAHLAASDGFEGAARHFQTVGGRSDLFALFMRRHKGGKNDDFVRAQLGFRRLDDIDVFHVHGIERAAENGNFHTLSLFAAYDV